MKNLKPERGQELYIAESYEAQGQLVIDCGKMVKRTSDMVVRCRALRTL